MRTRPKPSPKPSPKALAQRTACTVSSLSPTSLAIAISLSLAGTAAQAATITVDAPGATCSLIQAIESANNNATPAGSTCTAGSATGTDTIVLQNSSTIYITSAYPVALDGQNALPSITSAITINGNGSAVRRQSSSTFRIFHVSGTGVLSLNNLTIQNGSANSSGNGALGGGIFSEGTVYLNNSTVTGNTSQSGDGGVFASDTTSLTLNNSTIFGNDDQRFSHPA